MIGADLQRSFRPPLDRSFTLFAGKDAWVWAIFAATFCGLLLFDNVCVFGKPRKLGFVEACTYTFFWLSTALAFCFWVGWWQTPHSAYMWLSGYTLQWMMSFDNLFVFHLIFKVYQTPDKLKHRPLFLGILGQAAITFSLLTFGEYIFHKLYFLHIVFGVFFIYFGVSCMFGDDDDDDPTQNPMIQWLTRKLPFVSVYDTEGHFFVRLPVDEDGKVFIPACAVVSTDTRIKTTESSESLTGPQKLMEPDASSTEALSTADTSSLCCQPTEKASAKPGESTEEADAKPGESSEEGDEKPCQSTEESFANPGMIDISKIDLTGQKTEVRATMLFLVVCTMEIGDVIFSIDTIVAVSVQVGDLFLAFTCVAFALLTLRATFFIVEVLVQMFSLMKYGIGAILVYIGLKLMIDRWYLVPHLIDLFVLIGAFGGSIAASVISDRFKGEEEDGNAEQLLSSPKEDGNADI